MDDIEKIKQSVEFAKNFFYLMLYIEATLLSFVIGCKMFGFILDIKGK